MPKKTRLIVYEDDPVDPVECWEDEIVLDEVADDVADLVGDSYITYEPSLWYWSPLLDKVLAGESKIPYEVAYHPKGAVTNVSRLSLSYQVKWVLCEPRVSALSPEWFAARLRHITATDVACILKIDGKNVKGAYKTRKKVKELKCGLDSGEMKDAPWLKHGRDTEPIAADAYVRRTGNSCFAVGFVSHPGHRYTNHAPVGATADLVTTSGIVVEIKCPYFPSSIAKAFHNTSRETFEDMYPHFACQVYTQCAVLGLCKAHFVQFVPARKSPTGRDWLNIVELGYPVGWMESKMYQLDEFWDEVLRTKRRIERAKEDDEIMLPVKKNKKYSILV